MADNEISSGSGSFRSDPRIAGDPATKSASQEAKHATWQTEQEARDAVGQAKNQIQSVLSDQKEAAAGQLDGIVNALRTTAEQLRKQDQEPVAGYVERAADGLDRFCGTIRDRDVNSLASQVQDFARRQPGVFLGGAIAVGFMAARFLKSSSQSEHEPYTQPSSHTPERSAADEPYSGESSYTPRGASTEPPVSTPT